MPVRRAGNERVLAFPYILPIFFFFAFFFAIWCSPPSYSGLRESSATGIQIFLLQARVFHL
jgi:hypothetical protein